MIPISDPKNTALLVVDMQYDYCSPAGALAHHNNYTVTAIAEIITPLSRFISFVRDSGVLVIFIRIIEDPAFMLKNAGAKIMSFENPFSLCTPNTKGFEYFGVSPLPQDTQIIKNSYDAFVTKDSHALLRDKGIETPLLEEVLNKQQINCLLFSGVLTSRCVDSTLRTAFHRGYTCIVAENLVAVPDQLQFEHRAALSVWQTLFAYNAQSADIECALRSIPKYP